MGFAKQFNKLVKENVRFAGSLKQASILEVGADKARSAQDYVPGVVMGGRAVVDIGCIACSGNTYEDDNSQDLKHRG